MNLIIHKHECKILDIYFSVTKDGINCSEFDWFFVMVQYISEEASMLSASFDYPMTYVGAMKLVQALQ